MNSRIGTTAILAVFAFQLVVASCASPPVRPHFTAPSVKAGDVDIAGSLLGAGDITVIPAREPRGTLAFLSPGMIGLFMKLDVLESAGYPAWRETRLRNLADAVAVPLTFAARLPEGGTERQSGMLYIPSARRGKQEKVTWVVFLKGTEFLRDEVPSRGKGAEVPLMKLLASMGYAVWAPDYAGMGDGPGAQEYCVPDSLAASGLDGLAAARTWLRTVTTGGRHAYVESGRWAVMGYSEGGISALATLATASEGKISVPGLDLVATYSMAGRLNLTADPFPSAAGIVSNPEYELFFVVGWARAYPDAVNMTDILLPGILEEVVPLFDGKHTADQVSRALSKATGKRENGISKSDIFTPEYLAMVGRDPARVSYWRIQDEKALDRWMPPPQVPLVLAATPTDTIISFDELDRYYQRVKAREPEADVTLVRLAGGTHVLGAVEGFLYAIRDLDRREDRQPADTTGQRKAHA